MFNNGIYSDAHIHNKQYLVILLLTQYLGTGDAVGDEGRCEVNPQGTGGRKKCKGVKIQYIEKLH